jgi:hypothetical protein
MENRRNAHKELIQTPEARRISHHSGELCRDVKIILK